MSHPVSSSEGLYMCIKFVLFLFLFFGILWHEHRENKGLESFQGNGSRAKMNLLHTRVEFPTNMTLSPEGEHLFGKHGLPGTLDIRKTQNLAPLEGCAWPRGPCTSSWDSDACPHWPLGSWSIFVPTTWERGNAFYLLCCLMRLHWEIWQMDTQERRIQSHDFFIFQVLIQSEGVNSDQSLFRRVCFLAGHFISLSLSPHLGMIGITIFPPRLSWRFYSVFKCPIVLPGT